MESRQHMKLEQVVYLQCVAELMISVLEAFPLWETTPLQPPLEKDSGSSSFSGSCVYGNAGSWPTPTSEAWRNTQEQIVLRALTTLYWLHGKEQILHQQHDSSYKQQCTVLKEQLAFLLNRLLLGHMPDPRLNMARIVTLGIASLPKMLDSNQPEFRPLTDLTLAFLQRVTTDQDVLASLSGSRVDQDDVAWMNQQGTLSIWALFCKSSTTFSDAYSLRINCISWNSKLLHVPTICSCHVAFRLHSEACLLICRLCDHIAALYNEPPCTIDCPVSSAKGIALLHSQFPSSDTST